jgi:hypothetical protein
MVASAFNLMRNRLIIQLVASVFLAVPLALSAQLNVQPTLPNGQRPGVQRPTGPTTSFKIGKLKYGGGGDWYANPSSLPNLFRFLKQNTRMNLALEEEVVEPGSQALMQYPLVYMTGHGNVEFTPQEQDNLRKYLRSGGFLFADDNYGMQQYIVREIKKLFPDIPLVEVPFSHPIYRQQWAFPNGLPKIHEHDGLPPKGYGIFIDGRLAVFLTYECDLGDGWEDQPVHNNPEELRQKALHMGANVVLYVLLQ